MKSLGWLLVLAGGAQRVALTAEPLWERDPYVSVETEGGCSWLMARPMEGFSDTTQMLRETTSEN